MLQIIPLMIGWWTIESCRAMVAYDCASADMNVTSISLLNVAECANYVTERIEDNIEIQVLQEKETYPATIYQCLVEIEYHVTYCGMHSHSSEMKDGWGTYLWPLTPDECKSMHKNREVTVFGKRVTGLRGNSSLTSTMTLAGWVNSDGKCEGGSITIGHNTWPRVLAVAKVKITMQDYPGVYRIDDGMVVLRSGIVCKYSDRYCIDANDGYLTWDTIENESCSRTSYQVLYRGYVSKIYVHSEINQEEVYTLYSIKDDKFLATLMHKGDKKLCGIPTVITDHPKLLIQEIRNGMTYFEQAKIEVNNMDIFLYVNAKFTHLEQHMRRELSKMYEIIVKDQCETKRQLLKTQLSLATIDPVEFAYVFTGKPGYTGVTIGEQIHVIQCKPVHVISAKLEGCFNEMPVNYSGSILYMGPKNHILQKTPTPVSCSVLIKPTFQLSGQWFASQNGLSLVHNPTVLTTSKSPKWVYTDAGDLANQGIYSSEDLTKLRSQLMYPSERKAISQSISSAINEDASFTDTSMFKNLLSKEMVEDTVDTFFKNMWAKFLIFGNLFSGIFGIMLLFKIIKWVFDTIVHSRGLYEVYGCGWALVASVWDAATTYLLTPRNVAKYSTAKESGTKEEREMTLLEIATASPTIYPDLQPPTNPDYSPVTTQGKNMAPVKMSKTKR